MRIVPKIIREHVTLTAFLWSQRASLLADDPPDMEAVKGAEQRLEANIDALRIACGGAWEPAVAQFKDYPEAGEMFVLGLLASWIGENEKTDQIVELVRENADARAGLVGALAWLKPAETTTRVREWLGSGDSLLRYLAVSALVEHKADAGARLLELLGDEDQEVAEMACKLAAVVGRKDCVPALRELVQHENDRLAFNAAWACSELGAPVGTSALRQMALTDDPRALAALQSLIANQPDDKTRLWLGTLNTSEETRHIAVRGAGMMGDRTKLPWLVGCMSDPKLAVAAGAAFLELHGPLEEIDDHFYPDAYSATEELGPAYEGLEGRIPRAETFTMLLNTSEG